MVKGQMEIMGVAFIVIIIVFGVMFYLSLGTNNNIPSSKILEYKTLGEATETAMLDTNIPECGYNLRLLIQNCVSAPYLSCAGNKIVCEALEDSINDMLSKTIGDKEKYNATIKKKSTNGLSTIIEPINNIASGDDCKNSYSSPSQPISTSLGPVYFIIEFCS